MRFSTGVIALITDFRSLWGKLCAKASHVINRCAVWITEAHIDHNNHLPSKLLPKSCYLSPLIVTKYSSILSIKTALSFLHLKKLQFGRLLDCSNTDFSMF